VFPAGTTAYNYGGSRLPNIVGNLNLTQGWGSAQLSAALQELNKPVGGALNQDTVYGYAIQGGLMLNLPAFAAGDVLWLQATYAEGAIAYLGFLSMLPRLVSLAVLVRFRLMRRSMPLETSRRRKVIR